MMSRAEPRLLLQLPSLEHKPISSSTQQRHSVFPSKLADSAKSVAGLVPLVVTALVLVVIAACSRGDDRIFGQETLDSQLGGETTRSALNNAFGLPAANLTGEERLAFEVGDSFFTQSWVMAPASTNKRDGLGPVFNARACAGCHISDGRSAPKTSETDPTVGLFLRISVPGETEVGGPVPVPHYGNQFQDLAILDVDPEGRMVIGYEYIEGSYADGTTYELRKPVYSVADLAFGPMPDDVLLGPRIAPPVFGVGLLEAIPAADILANADPDDDDGDGVSGRANTTWSPLEQEMTLGRFGWKAATAFVEEQVAGAFLGDMGITSPLNPTQNCAEGQDDCAAAIHGDNAETGTPEIDVDLFGRVTFYSLTLAVPAMRDVEDPEVIEGAKLFEEIGCASCHMPTFVTGEHDVAALENQTIHPFTDLLLHDMGPDLADGRPDFDASGDEWRTPPLWGIGLTESVSGHTFFLHDGRARDLTEAILWHGGEGEAAKKAFTELDANDRAKVLSFLGAL